MEIEIEIDFILIVVVVDDIKDWLEKKILIEKGIIDVLIEFDEDDGLLNWKK